jgi:hypothetical protein
MKQYKDVISLSKNERGIWDLDTIKGCKSGLLENENGCYNDCYAYKTAKRYGIDFNTSVERNFIDYNHLQSIIKQIEKIDMPFIRIGCSGDPSENWEHTIKIIKQIRDNSQLTLFDISSTKQIVIITRHWNILTNDQLNKIKKYNICINTSVSALDNDKLINIALEQYKRLKPYCKSVLRVVTADFNTSNLIGKIKHDKQNELLKNEMVIDTVFRPSSKNEFLTREIINAQKMSFMKSKQLISKFNKKAFVGKCENCLEMCGLNIQHK